MKQAARKETTITLHVDGKPPVTATASQMQQALNELETDDHQLYSQAVMLVRRDRKASTSYIQRALKIGYNRAAQLIELMETNGVVGSANHLGKHEVLIVAPLDSGAFDTLNPEEQTAALAEQGAALDAGRFGHNSRKPNRVGGVAVDQLKSIIGRVERLEEEKAGIAADIRDVYAEARGNGFDVKAIRKIIALRKLDAQEREEAETILDTYMRALGMQPDFFDGEEVDGT